MNVEAQNIPKFKNVLVYIEHSYYQSGYTKATRDIRSSYKKI